MPDVRPEEREKRGKMTSHALNQRYRQRTVRRRIRHYLAHCLHPGGIPHITRARIPRIKWLWVRNFWCWLFRTMTPGEPL